MNADAFRSLILSIAEARSLSSVLDDIVTTLTQSWNLALARLWLFQTDRECAICSARAQSTDAKALHLAASAGLNNRSLAGSSHRIEPGHRKIGLIASTREPLFIPKISSADLWVADAAWIERESIKSFAGQPLLFRGELLGVLAIFSRAELTDDDFLWLRAFADHAAVAIWNARAFDELNRLRQQLQSENEYLAAEVKAAHNFGSVIGQSRPLQKVLDQVSVVAGTDATVLVTGESGVGKELVARAIHDRGKRAGRPFVKVNCGAIPENLFESEVFGLVKGAFTGAIKDRAGRFELADGGDLFLDEIGELPLSMQAKLLRAIQEKQFERVGDTRTRTVDVRIISATNRDLKAEVQRGAFREDLYYRLSVFPIDVPPLRERRDDIAPLAQHFLTRRAAQLNLPPAKPTKTQLAQLAEYSWPGNIRELENVIERALIHSKTTRRLDFDLPSEIPPRPRAKTPQPTAAILTREEFRRHEAQNILAALQQANGKIFGPNGAASLLGLKPTTLASRIKSLGLKKQFVPSQ